MEKSLFEQMGGTYTQQGDYILPNLILPVEEEQPIGIWGQRHLHYIKQHRRIRYTELFTSGKLNAYLAELNNEAEAMFSRLIDYSGSPAHPGRSSAQPDRASAHLIRSAVQLMPVADQHTC